MLRFQMWNREDDGAMDDAKVQHLAIHLARRGFERRELVTVSGDLYHHNLVIMDASAELYIQPPHENRPDWTYFFDGHVPLEEFGKNSSAGAVLLVTVRNKHFALTFGTGRFLLNSECWEDRFGLKVALNCIGEGTVRSLDKHSLDQLLRHTREQASRDATPGEFGFDIEQDLLRAVTGRPTDHFAYGQRISGAAALNMTIPVHLAEIPDLLSNLYDRFIDTAYRTKFAWIDHVAELNDSRLESELNELLVQKIVAGATEHIWMAVPTLISWDKVSGFRFPSHGVKHEYEDIHLDHFIKSIGDPSSITPEMLSNRNVVCIDHDGRILHKWSVYGCIYAELDHQDKTFLLSGARWYRVDPNFVKETNAAFDRIADYEGEFPEFNDKSEGDYLIRVAQLNPNHFALMDRKNIPYGGGHSLVEFCDLFAADDLFHVKRYGQASALSHLFAQGLISGELFQTEETFRRDVNARLPAEHQLESPERRPKQGRFRIVFTIISDRPGPLHIPFFSRLNLKHAAKRLEAYGFRVAKAKISVSEEISKKVKLRQRKRR